MNSYVISVQFVNSNAKFGANERESVKDAVSNYNSKSLIAKNPKKITEYSFSDDELTMTLILESEAELPMPTKALRLLSSYLVEKTQLDQNLSGKQLFKMTTTTPTVIMEDNLSSVDAVLSNKSIQEFKALSTDEKLIEIYKYLLKRDV